ncbi:MAG: UDP-N-acetylmuramoyl-L-alanyl-D-glutamate--2,6-diaminopimelate ligase [Acidimicrobiaceae bacterium]|nr:UDP-N-acetylmuramoyl-L-alanyl-D-glutamate--2,6-diaminopimelate ligase [Acidimicrobiaceae bacterium]MXW75515.1 UDP-N-acetylmuramoyl-L-alanyl-D-glutamate--2,6-diaminopimelate ligase [Acidimicrobiaceae bacterium]MYC42209.1 UDP-N-acetylmuramoyl-L-alanyl-D-glutamate--2,6-diaminopimelate ligase [Acidimicrobiaceae bacterium]MYD05903.1 UDP-N-acetylmuramoyl-L-alanyl-D-glutamate--2,6-diaminopimelate ligase [Acidimicrobiaceae bacterium]MYI58568.1 UDP-N-acetylmuramoyl-L-alanyl-D-glutamate--2,6-diaminopi
MSLELARVADLVRVESKPQWAEIELSDVCHDSRAMVPGALFAAIPGDSSDGHSYAGDAVEAGAAAVLVERPLGLGVPELRVASVRESLGPVASAVHGEPSRALQLVGVTGTNGKTTTVRILSCLLSELGIPVAEVGTLTGERTTPEAPELQRFLADAVARDVAAVAMEVSSHGLAQHRVDGCRFTVAAFTNLGNDHLDYHGTIEEYFAAKQRLFSPELSDLAIVNVDSEFGLRLADEINIPVIAVGAHLVDSLRFDRYMNKFRWRERAVHLPLAGEFNVANAVMAAEIAVALGHRPGDVAEALATTPSVPGRFEVIDQGQPFSVVVDYAHTHDALEAVLAAARAVTKNSLIVVFGAGGNRDHDKRPMMGKVVRSLADRVVVTSDNPRDEPPEDIISAIVSGMPIPPDLVEVDRRRAIGAAFDVAREGDLVLLAGKGHETTQTIGSQVVSFDDRQVAEEELQLRTGVAS